MYPFGVTVEVYDTTRDRHGDTVAAGPVGTIEGCAFAPESSVEDNDKRAQTITAGSLYVPPTTVRITSQSRIRFDSLTWYVTGDPEWWRHPGTGWTPGGVIDIQRVREGNSEEA